MSLSSRGNAILGPRQQGSLPAPPSPTYMKNKVHQAGMCTQAVASLSLAGRRLILICGLIKTSLDYTTIFKPQGWVGVVSPGICSRRTSCPGHRSPCPHRWQAGILQKALPRPQPHPSSPAAHLKAPIHIFLQFWLQLCS